MSAADVQTFPDERLKLMFVCAHPSIDEAARTPLMLQTVLGLDAARIANAFLVAPSTMGQRLVRAKTKIRDAGLRFAVPEQDDIPDRMTDVLNAMYAAFGTGWDAVAGADERFPGLVDEAIYLARLMVGLMPNEPEAKGLLALMLYCEARRPARRGPSGEFIPLREQDAGLWLRDRIIEAESLLIGASRAQKFGRFQCEAAIQSVHCQSAMTRSVNVDALRTLYLLLAAHYPSVGVLVAQAAVEVEASDPNAALRVLDSVPAERASSYQPYWATQAHAYAGLGRVDEAVRAVQTAIGLTENDQVRAFLRMISAQWQSGSTTDNRDR
jgi:RNA polymerase sigma-70 factor (ECF subfamily)